MPHIDPLCDLSGTSAIVYLSKNLSEAARIADTCEPSPVGDPSNHGGGRIREFFSQKNGPKHSGLF